MQYTKDRLPRDFYIKEPGLKFNTFGRMKPATRVGTTPKRVSSRRCCLSIWVTKSHLRAVASPVLCRRSILLQPPLCIDCLERSE